jgi:hypothetical protein
MIQEQIAEIHLAEQQPNGRHQDVRDKRRNDFPKGPADDDAALVDSERCPLERGEEPCPGY